ncbi:TIGR00289 family protein [Methanobrevibacter sp. 87.7]|uniref:diphthine--ammonia ligase n=1 Tax=Methanobrevibacter sp. 87.7 TaxID=387957 RepID=UPI000B50D9A2|nr:TIGR00289 family protein [Methanobrevibacter sp. 87.7]OWT33698.1 TIGR00289 family protein [Methanobrevibacter sp. 87.7]
MKSAILFSGGKDSTMALYNAIENGDDVKYLLSMKSKNSSSYMFHVPNIDLTELISEAVNIPLITAETEGIKEKELDDLKIQFKRLKNEGIEAVYTGALYSTYQKSRIEKLGNEVGLKIVSPYWHVDEEEYMNHIIDCGFDVIICGVFAYGLTEDYLGRHVTKDLISDLKKKSEKVPINLAFEGGEAETFVLDGPIFNKRIEILDADVDWHFDNGTYIIKNAKLVNKD